MSWTRLDDGWTERPALSSLSCESRWHYLAMIQFCSRTGRLDGLLTIKDARRCSDIEDPSEAIADLVTAGLVMPDGGRLRLVEIHDHVPPPSVRLNAQHSKERMQRHRAHKAGDHSLCRSEHCKQAPVTDPVTRNTGTGRDRTGRALMEDVTGGEDDDRDNAVITEFKAAFG